ncbi:MAG TPA: ectonucleotide pyrophosphatase/phosphodiesterase [Puia sp.]
MKYRILFLLLVFCAAGHAQSVRHVVIISIDGFRPDFYQDPSWGAVNLRELSRNGASAGGVRGVFPTVTYPSHTTIMTGVMPAVHGIYYNVPFEVKNQSDRWYWQYDSIKAPTLWDAVRKAGLTSAAVSWPVTVGAPITYNLPEVWAWPAKGGEHIKLEAVSKNAQPAGLFEEVQQNATGKMEENDYSLDYLSGDENIARIGSYLIRRYKPALTALHLANTDHFEHAQGRDGALVRKAVASADQAVGSILEAIDRAGIRDSTVVIVLGDHGFVDTHSALYPNVWLKKAGLIDNIKDGAWKARFHANGGSAFLHLRNPDDKQTLAAVQELIARLPASQRKLFRVVSREEIAAIGGDPRAALALSAEQGIAFAASEQGEPLRASRGGTHGYFPDFREIQTGFIAVGPGLKKDMTIPVMGLEDVAPLVAKLLGLELPSARGSLYPGLLEH